MRSKLRVARNVIHDRHLCRSIKIRSRDPVCCPSPAHHEACTSGNGLQGQIMVCVLACVCARMRACMRALMCVCAVRGGIGVLGGGRCLCKASARGAAARWFADPAAGHARTAGRPPPRGPARWPARPPPSPGRPPPAPSSSSPHTCRRHVVDASAIIGGCEITVLIETWVDHEPPRTPAPRLRTYLSFLIETKRMCTRTRLLITKVSTHLPSAGNDVHARPQGAESGKEPPLAGWGLHIKI